MKINTIKILIAGVIASCAIACKKEISAVVPYESRTIITGSISNLSKPVTVTLQQTLPLDDASKFKGIEGAGVSLYTRDKAGEKSLVTRDFTAHQGNYTSSELLAGKIGNKYWIEVQLADGTRFKSHEETLEQVIPIKAVSLKKDHVEVKFSDPKAKSNYYRCVVEALRKGASPLDEPRKETALYDDVVFNGNPDVAIQVPSIMSDALSYKVTLENINADSYQFWLNLKDDKDKIEDSDTNGLNQLFGTPSARILGNIINVETQKRALGNFSVTALSIKKAE